MVVALTFCDDGGAVQLTGSVVENPHGLHLNTFRFSAKARLIVSSKIIGRPQTGQMTSFVDVASLLIEVLMHAMADSRVDINQPPWPAPWRRVCRLTI